MTESQSKVERLNAILAHLHTTLPELSGALVATTTGQSIAQTFTNNTNTDRLAAMAVTALSLGKRINDTLGSENFNEFSVPVAHSQMLIQRAGTKAVLVMMIPATTNHDRLDKEAREATQHIANVL